jgi:predicted amidohydrolase
MHAVNAGIWQFDIRLGDIPGNLSTVREGIDRLSRAGADLAVLPEMFSCGFDYARLCEHAARTPEVLDELSRIARENSLDIVGSLPEKEGDSVYNSLYAIAASGEIAGRYRKIHLFPPIEEDRHFRPGRHPVVLPTRAGLLGLMVCFDLRFPELSRVLALNGAQILIISAQWPAARISHWEGLLRARAIENQVFAIGVNRLGKEDGLSFNGRSQVVSPAGEVLCTAEAPEQMALARLDLSEIEKSREPFNCLNQRVPSAYPFPD